MINPSIALPIKGHQLISFSTRLIDNIEKSIKDPRPSHVAAENVGAPMFRSIVDDHEEIGTRIFL